jgi:hypothetical protein
MRQRKRAEGDVVVMLSKEQIWRTIDLKDAVFILSNEQISSGTRRSPLEEEHRRSDQSLVGKKKAAVRFLDLQVPRSSE